MFSDVIFLAVFIAVLAIIWIALNLNIRVRKQRVKQIKTLNLANYVTYINNFSLAEEEEKKGNHKLAVIHYRKALENLEDEEQPDSLVEEAKAEIRQRLAALEG